MLEDEKAAHLSIFEEEYEEGYYEGMRIGMCQSTVQLFRGVLRDRNILENIIENEDAFKDLLRFHKKYRNVTIRKMAEYLIAESEYLHGAGAL